MHSCLRHFLLFDFLLFVFLFYFPFYTIIAIYKLFAIFETRIRRQIADEQKKKSLQALSCDLLSVDSSFIHVKVGKNEDTRTFGVHETLLRRQSKFFQSALSGDWLESKTRTIELPEQTPAAFDLYFGWLYNRKIHSKKQDNYEGHEAELLQVAEAYCLAEMIGDGDFADAVMDTLLVCAAEYNTCPFKHANNLYEKLSQGSPLRRLVLEMWVYERRSKWRDTAMNLSEEVLRDIVLAIVEMKGPTTVEAATAPYKNGDRCAYHQHKKAVQLCYLTKHNSKRH